MVDPVTTHPMKLVTIITEAVIERDVTHDLEKLGARGYTITEARGLGAQGHRTSSWEQNANIRIEVICDMAVATRIVTNLRQRFYPDYAMVIYLSDIDVLRPEKFGA
jgi:nitrogen regulatory protein PII